MQTSHIPQNQLEPFVASGRPRSFMQNRLYNFGLTLFVMGASFILYYLGLFGGVPGPLQPALIGERLAGLGFTSQHLLAILLTLMVISITWNWVYNGFNRLFRRRMRCTAFQEDLGGLCAEPIVQRTKQEAGVQYICRAGHQCSEVEIAVVKKGTVSHFLWMMWLIFSAIVIYHMA